MKLQQNILVTSNDFNLLYHLNSVTNLDDICIGESKENHPKYFNIIINCYNEKREDKVVKDTKISLKYQALCIEEKSVFKIAKNM